MPTVTMQLTVIAALTVWHVHFWLTNVWNQMERPLKGTSSECSGDMSPQMKKKSLCYFAFFCTNGCIWSGSFGKLWSCLTVMHSFVIFLSLNERQATKSPPPHSFQRILTTHTNHHNLTFCCWTFTSCRHVRGDLLWLTKGFSVSMVDSNGGCTPNLAALYQKAPLIGLSCGRVDVFSCLPLFYRPTTCLPSIIATFWRDIWLWNKWTWAAQPLCHHGPHVHFVDALRVGRRFVFAPPFPKWRPRFKWLHFTAKQCTKVSENI